MTPAPVPNGRDTGVGGSSDGTVSVVIPAFDAAEYIAEAIDSVLRQTRPVGEVIVVDDGSTDDTASVAEAFGDPVRVVRQDRSGANPARNRGVRESAGEFIAFLDADDLWEPDKLAVQLDAFTADPAPDLVFGLVTQFRSPEIPEHLVVVPGGEHRAMVGHHLGAMLLRRETFAAVGRLDETNFSGDFVDWFARALEQHRRIVVVDRVVMRRRIHLRNKGRAATAGPEQYAKALRKVVDRRRTYGS